MEIHPAARNVERTEDTAVDSSFLGRASEETDHTAYPGWLCDHLHAHRKFIERLWPFPFDQPADVTGFLSFHQNDYLRLGHHPQVIMARAAANGRKRNESSASSIYGGATEEHNRFTRLLSESMQAGGVVLTTAGWTANVGLLEAITPQDCPVYIDMQAHASLGDGIRLSHGRRVLVKHNDPDRMETRIRIHGPGIVCIDAVYSTNGVVPDLRRYVEICERHNCALVLDEAHSFGVFGEKGGGLAVHLGLAERVHFRTISLSKALGGHGGAVAGGADVMRSVCARLRPVVFSSATSAVIEGGHAKALEITMEHPERAQNCLRMAALLRKSFHERGIDTGGGSSQIVAISFPQEQACTFYGELRKRGILTSVFLYPAVPRGTSLARFSVYSELTEDDVRYTVECVVEILSNMKALAAGNS